MLMWNPASRAAPFLRVIPAIDFLERNAGFLGNLHLATKGVIDLLGRRLAHGGLGLGFLAHVSTIYEIVLQSNKLL